MKFQIWAVDVKAYVYLICFINQVDWCYFLVYKYILH